MAAPFPLQAMDATALRAVLAELRTAILPSRFEKAQQADAHTVQLGLRSLEGRHWLELSWLAEAPRLHAIEPPPRAGAGSTLAQQLHHGLAGLALVELVQEGWERVVELRFAPRPGDPIQRSLVLELMGRHSNLFLLDGQRRVVAAARQVRAQQSRIRPIATGDTYGPPPGLAGQPPRLDEPFASWQQQLCLLPIPLLRALQGAYQGISPALALQLAGDEAGSSQARLATPVDELQPSTWLELWRHWQSWLQADASHCWDPQPAQCSAYRCWSPPGRPSPAVPEAAPLAVNHVLARYYRQVLDQRRCHQHREQLRHRLIQALERERLQHQELCDRLAAVASSDDLQRQADGLLCQPQPSRELVAEAQALYQRARKLRRSVAALTPRIEAHAHRLAAFEESLTFLEQLDPPGEEPGHLEGHLQHLRGLDEEVEALMLGRRQSRQRRRPSDGSDNRSQPQPLELCSASGLRLQVGRNQRQNAWISLSQARRGDLWFHAQECPGSHVVLKASEAMAQEADLQQAADLAAHFSRARGNQRVPVVMVPVEDLQRIAGTAPGTVRHRGGEILWGAPAQALALLGNAPRSGVTSLRQD